MCGICGKIYFDTARSVDPSLLDAMTGVLRHRGPDDRGTVVRGHVGLGHQRLSIIDLSSAAHQPMTNEDGTISIVYNGEIYNFLELRNQLKAQGHVFRSHSDTEVIIHLYEEKGTQCVSMLRGMFAFAIWDSREGQLFLARDRAGQKPLVYTVADGALLFASEIKSLLQDPSVATDVDTRAINHYLTYQYVPGPLTICKDIQKLPPAHSLVMRGGNVTITPYWNLSYKDAVPPSGLHDYTRQFLDVFGEAVRIRLRSDVPLGAFLSGGIDSSAIVALMSRFTDQPVKTFSIGFEHGDYNELPYARTVSRLFNTDHTEFIVKPDALHILPGIVRHYDEPFADPSAIPTWYVAERTRQHVTVALNGDGGDESFAGYERYVADRLAAGYVKIPRVLREKIIKKAVNVLPYREYRWSTIRRFKRFIDGAVDDAPYRYVQWLCYFNHEMKQALYAPSFMRNVARDSAALTAELYERSDAATILEKNLFADVMMYLPYDLLVKVDMATMAHSLEARSPFLDHKVMEFAAALPATFKLHGLTTKYILKKAFSSLLPREILHRKKMGFGVPLNRWFRSELRPLAYDILLDSRCAGRGYFRPKAVQRLLDEHSSMRADHSYRIWALLILELWHRMFIDKSDVAGI